MINHATTPPWLPGATAGHALAEALKQAWVAADRPDLGDVADRVGYARTTLSKVFAGKAPPTWHLVRKLGLALDVPPETVADRWHELWIAADDFRRGVPASRADGGAERASGGYTCDRCGSWVVDTQRHEQMESRWEADTLNNEMSWASLRDAVSRHERA